MIWGAPGVLVGQAVGGVIFGVLAWVLALRVIARPALKNAPPALVSAPLHPAAP
jgi:hypothetical protein